MPQKEGLMLETEAAPLIEKNYRWNFTVNVLDGATFWFGMSFLSSAVILPLFVSHFTSSPVLIGLIAFLTAAGPLLPQLLVAKAVAHAPRKIVFPAYIGFFVERLPLIILPAAVWLLADGPPIWALIAFFILYAWHCGGVGVILVGWQDLIAKIVPADRRGRFFGITNFIGNGTGILGALGLPFLLLISDFRTGFTLAFGVAALCMLVSWGFLLLTREPAIESSLTAPTWLDYLASLPSIVRQDGNFRRFLVSQSLTALSGMSSGFLLVHAVRIGSLNDAQAGAFTVWLQAGLALANLGFGFLADRFGHRRGLEWGLLLNVGSLLLAWLLAAPWAFSLIFFLRGAMSAAQFISGSALVYEFSAAEDRAVYLGLANTIPGLVGALAPLLGGFLGGLLGYPMLFAISAAAALAGWAVYRFGVGDPRASQKRED
jgi:MFS family permease